MFKMRSLGIGAALAVTAILSLGAVPGSGRSLTLAETRMAFGGAPQIGGTTPDFECGVKHNCVNDSALCSAYSGDDLGCRDHDEVDSFDPTYDLDCVTEQPGNDCHTSLGDECATTANCHYDGICDVCYPGTPAFIIGYINCVDTP